MRATLKAEIKKLLTVRSTYFIIAFSMVLLIFFAFYISGWHINKMDLHDPTTLATDVTSAISVVSIFAALAAVLLMTHEYRYNTIMYTLTSSNSRSKVLLSKILVVSGFAIAFTLFFGILSPFVSLLGIHLHHLKLVPQTLHYSDLLWRGLFFGWGYSMAGLLLAALIRSQIGTIIVLLVAPGTVESLLGLLLKQNVDYLPFSSLHVVIGQGMGQYTNGLNPFHALLVFSAYLIVGWIVAWILFLRRDATN
jgi:ABC-type transport system involved in multi-copper enzyme maturation permease subunit